MMHTYFCHNWGMGIMGWGWLIWLIIIALLVWLGVKLFNQGNAIPAKEDSALTILRERYARDEISKEEFEEKKKDLS